MTFSKFVWVVKTVFSSLHIWWQPRQISSNYKFLPFFLTIVVVLAIAACNHNTPMGTHKSTLARTPIETKIVSHALGKVEIPLQPQRVIVLEENVVLDSVVALGIKPVGVMYCGGCEEKFRGIPSDGSNAILLDRTLILSYRARFSIKTVIWLRSHP